MEDGETTFPFLLPVPGTTMETHCMEPPCAWLASREGDSPPVVFRSLHIPMSAPEGGGEQKSRLVLTPMAAASPATPGVLHCRVCSGLSPREPEVALREQKPGDVARFGTLIWRSRRERLNSEPEPPQRRKPQRPLPPVALLASVSVETSS